MRLLSYPRYWPTGQCHVLIIDFATSPWQPRVPIVNLALHPKNNQMCWLSMQMMWCANCCMLPMPKISVLDWWVHHDKLTIIYHHSASLIIIYASINNEWTVANYYEPLPASTSHCQSLSIRTNHYESFPFPTIASTVMAVHLFWTMNHYDELCFTARRTRVVFRRTRCIRWVGWFNLRRLMVSDG